MSLIIRKNIKYKKTIKAFIKLKNSPITTNKMRMVAITFFLEIILGHSSVRLLYKQLDTYNIDDIVSKIIKAKIIIHINIMHTHATDKMPSSFQIDNAVSQTRFLLKEYT